MESRSQSSGRGDPPDLYTDGSGQVYQAVVKNTFLETVDMSRQQDAMKRSASDSDLSRSSGEDKMKFWLPSLSSQSSQSHSLSSDNKTGQTQQDMIIGSGLPLQTLQGPLLGGRRGGNDHATGVAAEAFGLPTLCNTVGAPDGRTGASSSAAQGNGSGRGSAIRGTPVSGVPLTGNGVAYGSVAPGRLAHTAQAISSSVPASDGVVEQIHKETHVPESELQVLYQQGILQQIPKNDQGELSSIGSIRHLDGECSPCLFWFRKSCAKGIHCSYCHFRHKGQRNKRIRPSRKTRLQMRAGTERGDGSDEDDLDNEDDEVEEQPQDRSKSGRSSGTRLSL